MQKTVQAQDATWDDFATEVLEGLRRTPRSIPCRFLYDARGSELFEQITYLDEYYPTRTEIGLLERHSGEIAALAGPDAAIVEFARAPAAKPKS
jgi:uncharacterized SAM-dependent methyltransferase